MRSHAPLGIDHRDLARGGNRILGEKAPQASGRGQARGHQLQSARAIGDLGVGLRGHRTDADPRPRDDRADREPVRLDRDAELAGPRIAGDDRVGALPGAVADESTPRDDAEHIALTALPYDFDCRTWTRRGRRVSRRSAGPRRGERHRRRPRSDRGGDRGGRDQRAERAPRGLRRPPAAIAECGEPVDVLLVTTKAAGLDDALGRVTPDPGLVVPLLNGLDHMACCGRGSAPNG